MTQLSKNLYTVKQIDAESWAVQLTDATHPVFKAHFEGNPLLPAFLQIDIMGEILEKTLIAIVRCKFKHPILPCDEVVYKIVSKVENTYKIKILKEEVVMSEIKVSYQ